MLRVFFIAPNYDVSQVLWRVLIFCRQKVDGELKAEISFLHMKVLTLIKAKSNVFLWYVQCCSCIRRSKTKILTTRAPPSWIVFDVVTSNSKCFRLYNATWIDYVRLANDFSGFYKRSINAGTWKSTIKAPKWRRHSSWFSIFGFDFICKREILGCGSPLIIY